MRKRAREGGSNKEGRSDGDMVVGNYKERARLFEGRMEGATA